MGELGLLEISTILPVRLDLCSGFKSNLGGISRGKINHKMINVGRDLWWPSGLSPLLKHGHLEQAAQNRA